MVALALSRSFDSFLPATYSASHGGAKMSCKAGEVRFATPLDQRALAAFLVNAFPTDTVFCVTRTFDVSERTARNWLDCTSKPSADALVAMISAFGMSFLAAITRNRADWIATAAHGEAMRKAVKELRAAADKIEALQ